jgi:tRNA threonylcarbamoyladenosine biosynthesis protein TsaE
MSSDLSLPGEAATVRLGAVAAQALPPQSLPFVVTLAGDLGAGKTTFARALLQALGVTGHIRSPSYALLEPYEAGGWLALHLDLYRLGDAEELEMLGLRDYHQGRSLWLVEWPGRGAGRLPQADAGLHFEAGSPAHRVSLQAHTPAGQQWCATVLRAYELSA